MDPVTKGCGGLQNTARLVVQIKRLNPTGDGSRL
jgi:hypothetical protein